MFLTFRSLPFWNPPGLPPGFKNRGCPIFSKNHRGIFSNRGDRPGGSLLTISFKNRPGEKSGGDFRYTTILAGPWAAGQGIKGKVRSTQNVLSKTPPMGKHNVPFKIQWEEILPSLWLTKTVQQDLYLASQLDAK